MKFNPKKWKIRLIERKTRLKIEINLQKEEYEGLTQHKKMFDPDGKVSMEQYAHSLLAIGLQYFMEETIRRHNEALKNDPIYAVSVAAVSGLDNEVTNENS